MQLARVIGAVVATRKDENLVGIRLMLVQPLAAIASRRGGRWSRSMRSAPASAKRCFSSAAKRPASRSIRPNHQSMPASSASLITGIWADANRASDRDVVRHAEAPEFEGAKLMLVQPLKACSDASVLDAAAACPRAGVTRDGLPDHLSHS